jgi:CHAT domain-containing protein
VIRLVSATLPEKIRRFIAGARRLILSPHRSLHLLPFHAGRWDDGAFLIEHAAISYAPNLGSLLVQRDEVKPGIGEGLVAIGVNSYAVSGEHWPELKAAEAEAKEIAAIWNRNGKQAEALVGKAATIAGFHRLKDRLASMAPASSTLRR